VCRSAQLGDLQIVVSVGERGDGGSKRLPWPPLGVLRFLFTGER
jgi:hypothetical protein